MEKRTRERKVATAWETKIEEYWAVQTRSGWSAEYPTEAQAIKAEDFLANLNWKTELLTDDNHEDVSINLVSGHLKYPIEEVTANYSVSPLGFGGYEFKGVIGDFKALEVQYSTPEDSYTSLIVLDEKQQKQLLDFLNR